MTADEHTSSNDGSSVAPTEDQLNREMIEQFHEVSVRQHGTESEQARMWLQLLGSSEEAQGQWQRRPAQSTD
jgi:hypothetical protein